jgi:hypothetical protein
MTSLPFETDWPVMRDFAFRSADLPGITAAWLKKNSLFEKLLKTACDYYLFLIFFKNQLN